MDTFDKTLLGCGVLAIIAIICIVAGDHYATYREETERARKQKLAEIQLMHDMINAPEIFNNYCNKILKIAPMPVYTRRAFCNCITREFLDTLGNERFYYALKNSQADFSIRGFIDSTSEEKRDILRMDYQGCEYSTLGLL